MKRASNWWNHPDAERLEREGKNLLAYPPSTDDRWHKWGDLLVQFETAHCAIEFAKDIGLLELPKTSKVLVSGWYRVARAFPPDKRGPVRSPYAVYSALVRHAGNPLVIEQLAKGLIMEEARAWARILAKDPTKRFDQTDMHIPGPRPRRRKKATVTREDPWPAEPDEPFYRWRGGVGKAIYAEARAALLAGERPSSWQWADWFAGLPAEYAVDFANTLHLAKPLIEVKRVRGVAVAWTPDKRGVASFGAHRALVRFAGTPEAQEAVRGPLTRPQAERLARVLADARRQKIRDILVPDDEVVPPTVEDYILFGVIPGVSTEELKTAFRRLAGARHPDRRPDHPDAATDFAELKAAYDRLRRVARKQRTPLSLPQHTLPPYGKRKRRRRARVEGSLYELMEHMK